MRSSSCEMVKVLIPVMLGFNDMGKTVKEVCHTHNHPPRYLTSYKLQVNDCKINLLIQQHEKFKLSDDESIDSGILTRTI